MRRLVLSLPVLFLALSADRLLPAPPEPPLAARRAPSLAAALAALDGRSAGRFGRPGDALNMVFVGSPSAVRAALSAAGWTEVPRTIRESVWAGLGELLRGERLASAPPMNDYRVRGRLQAMNWAIPLRGISARHHFRLWDTGWRDARGRAIWWGSGDADLEVRWSDLSHIPDPDMDHERDFVAASLEGSPALERLDYAALPQIPRAGVNDKAYAFRTDGRALVVTLRDAPDELAGR